MKSIRVSASKGYDIIIQRGIMQDAGRLAAPFCKNGFAAVITDDVVDRLYFSALESSLRASGIRTVKQVIPNGEKSKNAANYIEILNFLAENQLTRSDTVIALGGGVVGDIAGFAAATYLRGVGFIQIPTTLLSMVDSSVGGKTAIDLESGKNLAGAFYQPDLVICDCGALDTLPDETFSDGSAEVIKYGVLGSRSLFSHLQEAGTGFDREQVIAECVGIKRSVVEKDEFDTGLRQLLNLGHTFGHAIELASCYKVTHGRAVAAGTLMASKVSARLGICSRELPEEIYRINEKFALPTEAGYPSVQLCRAMLNDKKRKGERITLVLPEKIGHCVLKDFNVSELQSILDYASDSCSGF